MEETTSYRDLLALAAVGVLAVLLVWWFGFRSREVYNIPPAPVPVVVKNELPADLRVFSGRVANRTATALMVEWVVPARTDLSGAKTFLKQVAWTATTVFGQSRIGSAAAPEKIAAGDVKAGDNVVVTAVELVESRNDLTAASIQVVLPPVLNTSGK